MKKRIVPMISITLLCAAVLVNAIVIINIKKMYFEKSKPASSDVSTLPSNESSALREPETPIKLTFTGDVLLSGNVERLSTKEGWHSILKDVESTLQSSDIAMVNLENPVSFRGSKESKQYTFRATPESLEALSSSGIDIVTLANNHILDFGEEALMDTTHYLQERNILYVGAGENLENASKPAYIKKKNKTIAFIASSRVIPSPSWNAGSQKPGVATTYNTERILEEIAKANESADIVVVYVHWGKERETTPQKYQRNLAKMYIDAGANMVIGSHPHVLQGLEFYKGAVIAYSLGNFVFTNSKKDTMILEIEVGTDNTLKTKVIPCEIRNYKPFLLKERQQCDNVLKMLENISFGVSIESDGTVKNLEIDS